ncbi:MAG: hypothetical protein Q9160_004788 [Pyrenula sp. 1 TL-2023]
MRITSLMIFYSVLSFLCIVFPHIFTYIEPWIDFYEAIALATFFLLLCDFVSPHEDRRQSFFQRLPIKDRKGNITSPSASKAYTRWWVLIFQYPVVAFGVAVATDITAAAGVYCEGSKKPRFASFWFLIIRSISVTVAVTAVLKMYVALKDHLAHHRPLAKLVAFKIIVFLGFFENIIFSILRSTGVTDPTSKLTYADMHVGIPVMVNLLQIVPISIFFHYAYTYRPYVIQKGDQAIRHTNAQGEENFYTPEKRYQGGLLGYRALIGALNPMDVFEGSSFAFKMATGKVEGQAKFRSTASEPEDMLAPRSQHGARSTKPASHNIAASSPTPAPQPYPGQGYDPETQGQRDYHLDDYGRHSARRGRGGGHGRRRGGPITALVGYLRDRK